MKKISTLFLTCIMILSLSACGSDAGETSGESQPSSSGLVAGGAESSDASEEVAGGAESPNASEEDAATADSGTGTEETEPEISEPEGSGDSESVEGKTLIVYYSATGNTKEVAEHIASATGGDLFELVPAIPYSSEDLDWTDDNSRVTVEHEDPSKREVELEVSTVENWDAYDTVFIGFPLWWQIAAWPVDTFVKANDFTGKTVIPFCTSSSSDLGESGELLAEMAGTGNWLEGMRFRSGVSGESVTEWVEGLEN